MRRSKFIRPCKVLIFNGAYSPKGGGVIKVAIKNLCYTRITVRLLCISLQHKS